MKTPALGLLMVSPIPYHSFKNVRIGKSYSATVIPVIVSILLIIEPGLNFFLVGLAYVVSGPAGYLWRWRTGRVLEPTDEPDPLGKAQASRDATRDEGVPNVTSLASRMGAGEQGGGEAGV